MQTQIKQLNDVEYELDVSVTPEDLSEEVEKALRQQRSRTTMRGFRPGKVPLSLVRKMYGQAIGEAVAAERVQKIYEEEVLGSGEYDVLGRPQMTRFAYGADGSVQATVRFGVRPAFELKDLKDVTVSRLVYEVTEEDIDKEIERLREKEGDLVPVDEPAGEDDVVIADVQEVDAASGMPIIGKKDENQEFYLDDEELRSEIREALLGKRAGDTVTVTLRHDEEHEGHAPGHTHTFMLTVREVKRRELPELDEAFVKSVTNDRLDSLDALRAEIREHLEKAWARRSRELMEEDMVERIVEAHPVPVPESVVETFLDGFIEELKGYFKGEIPQGFDVQGYRASRRDDAVKQARWMFIRDRLIEEEGLEVTDEDRRKHFEEMAEGADFSAEDLQGYYRANRYLMDQLNQRLQNEKVFEALARRFTIVDKDLEAYQAEREARQAEAAAREAARVGAELAEADAVAATKEDTPEDAAPEDAA